MSATRRHTLTAWLLLMVVDLAIASGGFPRVHRLVRRIRVSRRHVCDEQLLIAAANDATARAAVWYPRAVQCLHRSAVIAWLLRRDGLAAVLVIGIRKMPFYAHAWVEVGGRVANDAAHVKTLYPAIDRLAPEEAR